MSSTALGYPAVLAAALAIACGSSAPSELAPASIDASRRAAIEAVLTRGEWVSGYSGSTVWHWETQRFVAPDRYELRAGHRSHGSRGEEMDTGAATPRVGTYRVTEGGAVEIAIDGTTTRRTFVVAPDGHGGRVWAHHGLVAIGSDRRRFRHEASRESADPEMRSHDALSEIEFSAPLETLETSTCRMRVRIRVRTREGGRQTGERALDLDGGCTIDRSAPPIVRVSFEGFEDVEPVQASAELSNWLWRTGRRQPDEPVAMSDATSDAFVPVLAYDPAAPDALFAAYVSGPAHAEREAPPPP